MVYQLQYLMLFHRSRMSLILSNIRLSCSWCMMMSPCIGSSIEGNCSITSIEYCYDFFNSSRGFADLGLRSNFTASTEDL